MFVNSQPVNNLDLVFCPLQKTWVKRNPAPEKAFKFEPLEEICAANEQKESFIFESFQKLALAKISLDIKKTENLFFDYAEKGKEVFTMLSNSHSLPETQLSKADNPKKAIFNLQKDFIKKETGIFLLPAQPRPPTFQITANFISQKFVELKNISRKISPRAPPVFV